MAITLSLDGQNVSLEGKVSPGTPLVHGLCVDGVSPWVIVPSGGITVLSRTIDPGVEIWPGGFMIDPAGPVLHGFDNRVVPASGRGPGANYSAGLNLIGSLPLDVDLVGGVPKTLWFYRGSDAVVDGSENSGAWAYLQITLLASDPGPNLIKPPGLAGFKPLYTTADIDYNALGPGIAIPSGAVEPSWNVLTNHFLARPLVHMLDIVNGQMIGPNLTEETYPAYQAVNIGKVALGAISNSANRVELINRLVRDGLHVEACIQNGMNCWIANGGFGHGGKFLRHLAGVYLDEPSLRTIPANIVYTASIASPVSYFTDDPESGQFYLGSAGQPLFGDFATAIALGNPQFGNNNVRADPREPWWATSNSGTAQGGGGLFSIQLSASSPNNVGDFDRIYITGGAGAGQLVNALFNYNNTTKIAEIAAITTIPGSGGLLNTGTAAAVGANTITLKASGLTPDVKFNAFSGQWDLVYISGGTGAGQYRWVSGYNSGTRQVTVDTNWSPALDGTSQYEVRRSWIGKNLWSIATPDATSTYEISNGGSYQADLTRAIMAASASMVLTRGYNDPTEFSEAYFGNAKRWYDNNGLFVPAARYPQDWENTNVNQRLYLDDNDWTEYWFPMAAAIWPSDEASAVLLGQQCL